MVHWQPSRSINHNYCQAESTALVVWVLRLFQTPQATTIHHPPANKLLICCQIESSSAAVSYFSPSPKWDTKPPRDLCLVVGDAIFVTGHLIALIWIIFSQTGAAALTMSSTRLIVDPNKFQIPRLSRRLRAVVLLPIWSCFSAINSVISWILSNICQHRLIQSNRTGLRARIIYSSHRRCRRRRRWRLRSLLGNLVYTATTTTTTTDDKSIYHTHALLNEHLNQLPGGPTWIGGSMWQHRKAILMVLI